MHLKSNSHIGGMAISAALALGQKDNWTGDQLLRAVVAAYDLSAILGTAVQQSPGYNRHMRPSGTIGAFAVAAGAIAATDVGEDIAVNALAHAANMSSGFNQWAWSGAMEIFTEMGTACQQGIVAFDLANAGMLCSEDILEGRAGYFAAFSASQGAELFRRGLEKPVGAGIDDVRFKPVGACNYVQTPASVALKLAKRCDASQIESVFLGCTTGAKNYPGCDYAGPFSTVQQTKMSLQFAVAATLIHADTSESVFNKVNDKEIEALAAKCSVEALDEYKQAFEEGRQPARIEVKMADGLTVEDELSDVPWLDDDQVRARFQAEVIVPSPDALKQLLADVQDLQALKSVGDLVALYR